MQCLNFGEDVGKTEEGRGWVHRKIRLRRAKVFERPGSRMNI